MGNIEEVDDEFCFMCFLESFFFVFDSEYLLFLYRVRNQIKGMQLFYWNLYLFISFFNGN